MLGLQIGSQINWFWVQISAFLGLLSLLSIVFFGPSWVMGAALFGLSLGLVGLGIRFKTPKKSPSIGWFVALLGCHIGLLLGGYTLKLYFVNPLPTHMMEMPKLVEEYREPNGMFKFRGPADWSITPLVSGDDVGVRMLPKGPDSYMGVSELRVLVRILDQPPEFPDTFLSRMADSLSKSKGRAKKNKLLEFYTEHAELLSGNMGVWTSLTIRRFWIFFWVPVRQVTLFGLKDKKFLCSVTATGLRNHDALFKIACLGLFEALTITTL